MKVLPWILVVFLAIGCVYLYMHLQKQETIVSDTITYVDTVKYRHPIPVDSTVIRHEVAVLPVYKDTLIKYYDTIKNDSAKVIIPITQKEYNTNQYHAWVSGYRPNLDSIHTFIPTTTIYVKQKVKRWGLGIQAGYSYPNGLYVGVGISYNLWQ